MATTTMIEPVPDKSNFVTVRTTLPARPLPPHDSRPAVTTERLLIRPLCQDDLAAMHALRTQPETMKWTSVGRIDRDLAETQTKLDHFLPPNDAHTYNFGICLKETGEWIGVGGCHNIQAEFGWPEIGYMIRSEHWGTGLATEFVRAFRTMWQGLPRAEVDLKVDPRSATSDGVSDEQLVAITAETNGKSQAILRKCGFELFITWKDDESNEDPDGGAVPLPTFRFFPSRPLAGIVYRKEDGKK